MLPGTPIGRTASGSPAVSVVVPVRDVPGRWLAAAVRSALDQDYPGPIEVLVCDDGTTTAAGLDALDRVAATRPRPGRSVRILLNVRHPGIAGARNTASAAATGEWLLWLDGDDRLPDGAVRALVSAARRPEVRLVAGQCGIVRPSGAYRVHRNEVFLHAWRHTRGTPEDPLLATVFAVHGALVRRDAFRLVGGFEPRLSHGELTDWFHRLLAALRTEAVAVSSQVTYRYTKRYDSHSADRSRLEAHRCAALRRYAALTGVVVTEVGFLRRCLSTGARLYTVRTTDGIRREPRDADQLLGAPTAMMAGR